MNDEDRLLWVLNQTNEWLKFAEAKNAALVLFGCAVLTASTQVLSGRIAVGGIFLVYQTLLWVFGGFAVVVALFSFLPHTSMPRLGSRKGLRSSESLMFFGEAGKHTAAGYLSACSARYGTGTTLWDRDLAAQIVINSRIAIWKYTCFRVALWSMIWAVLTPAVGALTVALLYAWNRSHIDA